MKWSGVAGVIPAGTERLTLEKAPRKAKTINKQPNASIAITETPEDIQIETGLISVFIPRRGDFLIDSLLYKGTKVGEKARLICNTQNEPIQENTSQISFTHYIGEIKSVTIERLGSVRALVKLEGIHRNRNKKIDTNHSEGEGNYANNSDMNKRNNREWLPFVVRLYFYGGSEQIKMVHSFIYDGDQKKDFIRSLGIRFDVPMREALYNRHIAFSCADGGVWSEPVQPLVGRRILTLNKTDNKKNSNEKKDAQQMPTDDPSLQQQQMEGKRIPPYESFDEKNRSLLDNWASWNDYRLSQLTADAFSIRKRANNDNPWIGTFSGTRSDGYILSEILPED